MAIVPAYQGRVMTSTVGGDETSSHGWINYELTASGKLGPHINAFGGEDRFWLGPEGGQFSIFFKKGDPFDLEHWQTPAVIDTVPYKVTSKTDSEVTFRHEAKIKNYSDTAFSLRIDRTVRLFDRSRIGEMLGTVPAERLRVADGVIRFPGTASTVARSASRRSAPSRYSAATTPPANC